MNIEFNIKLGDDPKLGIQVLAGINNACDEWIVTNCERVEKLAQPTVITVTDDLEIARRANAHRGSKKNIILFINPKDIRVDNGILAVRKDCKNLARKLYLELQR